MIVEIYDLRLGKNRPGHTLPKNGHGITVLLADQNFPIALPFGTARALAAKQPIAVLRILCHGNWTELELGKEEINFKTVHNFGLLAGAFQKDALIALYSCSTVEQLRPSVGPGSDPRSAALSFVKNIADITKVPVMAAPELQYYSDHRFVFGKWEGKGVYVITPAGAVVRAPALGSWHEGDMEKVGLSKGEMALIKREKAGHFRPEEPFRENEPIWRGSRF
jgi:hypothetical protein